MNFGYSNEKNVQLLVALLKNHGIKRIIASPGTTNVAFVASVQNDPFFQVWSAAEERSAAYMACGIAAETGEPVVISCTGATASRNYLPGLTEAFYRKLPVLAVTSTQNIAKVGQLIPQVIDRSSMQRDIARHSLDLRTIHCDDDEKNAIVQINKAILELSRSGGGPVHINLETTYDSSFSVKTLPKVRLIKRVSSLSEAPNLLPGRVAIFVGAHAPWKQELTETVDRFCEAYDGVVLCDQTSNYRGKYRILPNIICNQVNKSKNTAITTLIHIGEVSGAYVSISAEKVWRVCQDGDVCDTFGKLTHVFEIDEESFFRHYTEAASPIGNDGSDFFDVWESASTLLASRIPDLPYSNIWLARNTAPYIPAGSSVHLGILNSLRSWNFTETPSTVTCFSNTGGFGIDGGLSTLIGASLINPNKLYFGVIGDLAFFYDMNSLGNRHLGPNLRILLINNGKGTEFRNYNHHASIFGEETDTFIAAAGHYGRCSRELVRHYAEDLGFLYYSAESKDDYLLIRDSFLSPQIGDRPILIEAFTNDTDESEALKLMNSLDSKGSSKSIGEVAKNAARSIVGDDGVRIVKRLIGRG